MLLAESTVSVKRVADSPLQSEFMKKVEEEQHTAPSENLLSKVEANTNSILPKAEAAKEG